MDNDDHYRKRLEARYFPVAPAKFVALSILTFTIYPVYWFYKNWHYVRARDESSIWPLWRALFSPLWCYFLVRDIRINHPEESGILSRFGGLLALAYSLLMAIVKLPDPLWFPSLFAFVVLLPTVFAINRVEGPTVTYQRNSKFRVRHFVLMSLATPLFLFGTALTFYLVPGTAIVDGSRVPSWHVDWMLEHGMLTEDETIEHFYSAGLFSFRTDGNVVTDQSVVSYWQHQEATYMEYAYYEDISSIDVTYSDSTLEDTVITVMRTDGSELVLFASTEEDKDHAVVATIEARRGQLFSP